ncbi:hypothetical protein C8A00DRAFT_31599 [Chaetomidium leptoderma]|uniref:Xylanolytic transcriptional activator regulatory domain-containing protein n=1 Tax=Chaetomidium leptoderma TaxID=669021 RepID=A0AAN6ZXF5_9PEZI|nr:hypothetical protein C8A00DRAFT_31599 [Chaetomidium leptoderma]
MSLLSTASRGETRPASRKRSLESSDRGALSDQDLDNPDDSGSDIDVSGALNGLGYMSHHHHLVLGQGPGPKAVRDKVQEIDVEQSEELKAALPLMPEKRYTDCLVDNWLNGANHQYYALYPPEFRTQYDGWWATPRDKVSPELTSLILRVCACSLHFIIEDNVKVRLETELATDVLTFADRMHAAAEKLGASIPPGKGGLVHVQQLFLTAFWFKSAERWTEAWHALSKAILAANEIGLHQDALSEGVSEFDREMRRRMWVILYLWDFALGSMLSREFLVNHANSTVVMPTLTLENNPERPDQPSPFRHMNLHCQLCIDMAAELGDRSGPETTKAERAKRMQDAVESWFDRLPGEYAVKTPETRWDGELEWVVFQRRYLHLIGYMGLFTQLRPFIIRSSAEPMSDLESSLRAAGVEAALGLMRVAWLLFENLVSVGAKFHYAVFCIFDAATVMCSAFLHDEARNLPQREEVLEAVRKALGMLAEVAPESKTSVALHRILKGLLTKLPLSAREQGVIGATKRVKHGRIAPPSSRVPATRSPNNASSSAKGVKVETRRSRGPRHRSSSASSDSDSTLDSSQFQPRSESSVSVSDSCQSMNAQVASAAAQPPRRGSVVPSNGVARVDGLPGSNAFIPSDPVHVAYPATTNGFMPATNVMSFMPPDGFHATAPGYVPSTEFHQYSPPVSPEGAIPYSPSGWPQPSQETINGMSNNTNLYQANGLGGFADAPPSVLALWQCEQLGLGNPETWSHPFAQMPGQSGSGHYQAGLPGAFCGQGMANDCGESSSTEGLGR